MKMSVPACQICAYHGSSHGGFHCPSCTRAALYSLRLRHASILLDREQFAGRVEKVVSNFPREMEDNVNIPKGSADNARYGDSAQYSATAALLDESRRSIDTIAARAVALRNEMQAFRQHLMNRKRENTHRRSYIQRLRLQVASHQGEAQVQASTSAENTQARLQGHLMARRLELLTALGFWARLRRTLKFPSGQEHESASFAYSIGGLNIPDLRTLHLLKDGEEQSLTAVLTHICRLLHLVSRYLQVRLPAELVVPHRDWPLPMIMSPLSSYTGQHQTFPHKILASSSGAKGGSVGAPEDQFRTARRPRPLFLLRPLRQVAADDPPGYARFVEAVALLGWNITWLCRTQGISVADQNWEEVCNMGQNLWRLIIIKGGDVAHLNAEETSTNTIWSQTGQGENRKLNESANVKATHDLPPNTGAVGVYSHGSAHSYLRAGSFLGPQSGIMDVSVRGWPFGNPLQILSELRAHLLGEIAIMEAVIVGDDGEEVGTAQNGMQLWEVVPPSLNTELDGAGEQRRETLSNNTKEARGWLKLRNRG